MLTATSLPKVSIKHYDDRHMEGFVRGLLGLGLTLFVLEAGILTLNGAVRGWAMLQLQRDPQNNLALALLALQ